MPEPRVAAGLRGAIPALPVRDLAAAAAFYRDRLGFTVLHEGGIVVLGRDDVVLHLWEATDATWHARPELVQRPVHSGGESFLAGTGSCRIETDDPDGLWAELEPQGVLHPTSRDGVLTTDFGTDDVHTLDLDGNLVSFFRWERQAEG